MTTGKILLLPGDGVGVEIMNVTRLFLDFMNKELGFDFICEEGLVGGSAYEAHGKAISESDMKLALSADAILFGAVGGPQWESVSYDQRPEAGLLRLRKELDLFANLRPALCYPALTSASSLKAELVNNLDILIVRELTGGVYFGEPKIIRDLGNGKQQAIDTQIYNDDEIERIAHIAFQLARQRNKHVTSMEKHNVMKTGVLWREIVTKIHQRDYPDIALTHMLADSGAMQLVRAPKQFDVIVTDNLFGDILSDVAAMLTGSLGMLPSASLGSIPFTPINKIAGKRRALYEPVHGSAPDIAGKGIVNPIAMIASLALCLRYSFGLSQEASCLEKAIAATLDDGLRTMDIYHEEEIVDHNKTRKVSCHEMGTAILTKFKSIIQTEDKNF